MCYTPGPLLYSIGEDSESDYLREGDLIIAFELTAENRGHSDCLVEEFLRSLGLEPQDCAYLAASVILKSSLLVLDLLIDGG